MPQAPTNLPRAAHLGAGGILQTLRLQRLPVLDVVHLMFAKVRAAIKTWLSERQARDAARSNEFWLDAEMRRFDNLYTGSYLT